MVDRGNFETVFGKLTLAAEQVYGGSQTWAHENWLVRGLRGVSQAFTTHGNIEPNFRAENREIFPLHCVLIPAAKMRVFSPNHWPTGIRSIVYVDDGDVENKNTLIRWFIHPLEREKHADLISQFPRDDYQWMATPTASHRTVFVLNPLPSGPRGFQLKLSLDRRAFAMSRRLGRQHLARSNLVDAIIDSSSRNHFGKTTHTWHSLREVAGVIPRNLENEGGYIIRQWPQAATANDVALLPFFSLCSVIQGSLVFHKYIGTKVESGDRKAFLVEKFVKPMLNVFSHFSLAEGIPLELHKQNAGFLFNTNTGNVAGLFIRDWDGTGIDCARRRSLNLTTGKLPKDLNAAQVLRTRDVQLGQPFYYVFMWTMTLEPILRALLPLAEVHKIVQTGHQHFFDMVGTHLHRRPRTLFDLVLVWEEFYRQHGTADERRRISVFDKWRTRGYNWLRDVEGKFLSISRTNS